MSAVKQKTGIFFRFFHNVIAIFAITFAVLPAQARSLDAAKTSLSFYDRCTSRATKFAFGGRTSLLVRVSGLTPNHPFIARTTVVVASQNDEAKLGNSDESGFEQRTRHQKTVSFIKKIDSVPASGVVTFSHRIDLDEYTPLELSALDVTVWRAQVTWNQDVAVNKFGGDSSWVFSVSGSNPRFYRIVHPLCTWETPATVTSKYYFNANAPWMNVSREYRVSDIEEIEAGVNFGIAPDESGLTGATYRNPVGTNLGSDNSGWLFGGFSKSSESIRKSVFNQTWRLSRDQGGFITERLSFMRAVADEYHVDDSSGCPQIKKFRQGFLDVGLPTTEFVMVPEHIAHDEAELPRYLQKARPELDTCKKIFKHNFDGFFDDPEKAKIPGSQTEQEVLLFYPASPKLIHEVLK